MRGHTPVFGILDELSGNPQVVWFNADDDDDNLSHLFCCNQDLALCGRDLEDWPLGDSDYEINPDFCVVCATMTKCPVCGDEFKAEMEL